MSDNKNLPQKKDSAEVALQKTTSLLSITNKILANRANRTLVVSDDAWLDERFNGTHSVPYIIHPNLHLPFC